MSQSSRETRKEYQRLMRKLSPSDKEAMNIERTSALNSGKSCAKWLSERKKYWAGRISENKSIGSQNMYGFTDLTPYNAITGKDRISKATLTDCKHRVDGSFNG